MPKERDTSWSADELTVLSHTRRSKPISAKRAPANVLFTPDGRMQLSSGAMQELWGEHGPFKDREAGPLRVRLMAKFDGDVPRVLLIAQAPEGGDDTIAIGPVGRKEVRWPVVYVARAASIVRQLGIYGRVRYPVRKVKVRMPDGKSADALEVDLSAKPMSGSPNQLRDWLLAWRDQASPGRKYTRDELVEWVRKQASREGVPPTPRMVDQYVRTHLQQLERQGMRFTLVGKTTFSDVTVIPRGEKRRP